MTHLMQPLDVSVFSPFYSIKYTMRNWSFLIDATYRINRYTFLASQLLIQLFQSPSTFSPLRTDRVRRRGSRNACLWSIYVHGAFLTEIIGNTMSRSVGSPKEVDSSVPALHIYRRKCDVKTYNDTRMGRPIFVWTGLSPTNQTIWLRRGIPWDFCDRLLNKTYPPRI